MSQPEHIAEVHFWGRIDEPGRYNLAALPESAAELLRHIKELKSSRWPLNLILQPLPRHKRGRWKMMNPVTSLTQFARLKITYDPSLERAFWVDQEQSRLTLSEEGLQSLLLHLDDLVQSADDDATWSEGPSGSDEQAIWFWSW